MHTHRQKGLTLIETLIAVAFFAVVSVALYQVYAKILQMTAILNTRTIAASLANEQFEIIRNMPYASVGTAGGIPSGAIPQSQTLVRDGTTFTVTITIRNIDEAFDGTLGGSPNDLSPADNKLVAIEVACPTCSNFTPVEFTSHVAPKNLETASTNGALVVKVFDANGLPVTDAQVTIDNTTVNPAIHIVDVTGVDGTLTIVDAPPAATSYHIAVTKSGFSLDQTYPPGASGNPNPLKPDATVVIQQITQVSLTIDHASTLTTNSILDTCATAGSVTYLLTGSKLIGTSPDVIKYDQSHTTNGSGTKTISNLEWDTYNIALNDSTYDLIGTNPLLSLGLLPNTAQTMQLIVAPKSPKRLLVVVRDQSTGLPITDASVELSDGGGYDNTLITGEGFLAQSDWSGGSGQAVFTDQTQYFTSDGNIDTSSPAGQLKLHSVFGTYAASGNLTSSTFDTNDVSNFHQIFWTPTNQPAETGTDSVQFQVAANNDNTTWNFTGPDGTNTTYYDASNQNISSLLNGNRYFRYRVFLSTDDTAYTPSVSDISFTFTTSCTPPGQVSFAGLSSGDYGVMVTRSGYQTYNGNITMSSNWQKLEVVISP